MQKPNDVRKFVIGAEQAEARGDHAEAERLLRRALVLQEFSLGAEHIEVAKTLNNLAIVSEMNGRLGDAEACYRRAFAIAVSKLAPTDPFFVTSRENLEQFCQARGLPFNPPVSPRSSPEAPMRPPAAPPRAAAPLASAPPASAPATTAPPKTVAPPIDPTLASPGTPAKTVVPPRVAAPPKPVTAPRTTAPASPAHPASMADMPFLSEATMSPTSTPTRVATPRTPVPPPRAATTGGAARSVPLEDMQFRSEAAIAPPAAPARADATLPMTHSAVPVPVGRRGPGRAIMLGLAALVLVTAGWYWFSSSTPPERAVSSAVATAGSTPAPAADPAPPQSKPSQPAPSAADKPGAAAPPATEPVVPPRAPVASAPAVATAPAPPPAATRPSSSITVVTSHACRSLTRSNAWTCTPATGTQSPGRLYFYTRVASPRDTTIEHRWYRGDRLEQTVSLGIRANAAGYRTYSQLAISPDRAGSWKVELRTQDGQVLDQQTFSVR